MIYDYKNIPWHLFVRQEDIDKQIKLEEQKKKEKALGAINKQFVGKQSQSVGKQAQSVSKQAQSEQTQSNIDFFSLEPTELNLDDN
jgi:hypothetical protein